MMSINTHSSPDVLDEIKMMREEYKAKKIPTILDDALNFLILTLNIYKPKKILEIGTATGMSGICMLDCIKNAHLTTIERDEDAFLEAEKNFRRFKQADRIKQFLGDAGDILNFLDSAFDFIFLDGSKARYYDYMYDLLRLLKVGGVIVADNVLFRGYIDGSVGFAHSNNTIVRNMRAFINEMINDKNLITQILNIGDGILISYKKNES